MSRYNHMYTIAFSVENESEDGEATTADEIRAGLERRIADLDSSGDLEWHAAVGGPEDTFEEDDCSIGELPELVDDAPSHWDDDPDWPVCDWQTEVANNDTRQSYHEWAASQREAAEEDLHDGRA